MANVMDILNKYRSKSEVQNKLTPATKTYGGGGVTRDLRLEAQRAEMADVERQQAGALAAEEQVAELQREQQDIQQTQQITELRQIAKAEKQRFNLASNQVLDDLERNMKELSSREKLDRMEVAAAQIRLSDEQYRYNLENVARRDRLETELGFNEAMKRAVFEDEMDLLRDDLEFNRKLDADEREFQEYLSNIDIDYALQMARTGIEQTTKRAMMEGGIEAVSKGAGYVVSKYQPTQSTQTQPAATAGGGGGASAPATPSSNVPM